MCFLSRSFAQKDAVGPLRLRLSKELPDTTRVELLRKLSMQIQASHPDSALLYARQGLALAQKINFKKGEADCLNRQGVVLWKNGKYDQALQSVLSSLKIREEANDQVGQLTSLNDIGIIYTDQNDYVKALWYHFKAKDIAESLHAKRNLSIILSNIGNCYIKLGKADSALDFEMRAYEIQHAINDQGALTNTLSILGDINLKMGHQALAIDYYRLSVVSAINSNDQTELADTYNSIAGLYSRSGKADSAVYYATRALNAAKAVAYPEGIYNAGNLLTHIYQGKDEHLEMVYLKTAMTAKDSMFNAEKIKQVQILSFNESSRQQEIAEEKHREAEQRIINLQLIGIAVFIPFFFLLLLFLSKSRTHRRVIDFMSGLSLLLVFEFITLFIHPFVQRISNHLPILELGILVALAAVLVPMHHKATHWLREKLVHIATHHPHHAEVKKDKAVEVAD
ncbi:MAG: tetratricopeptide repeat protein [Bacteroidota bacterium]|nr:tetratricopeptide repeat protein [Bacteroidota bacterium]